MSHEPEGFGEAREATLEGPDLDMKDVEEAVSSPKWLLLVLILTLGGFAFACSGGNGSDAPATLTPRDSGDAAIDTPADETEAGSSTPAPDLDGPVNGTAGDPEAPRGPQAPGSPPSVLTSDPAGPAMRLTLVSGGSCTGSDCFVDAGSTFTLGVEVLRAPASGYVLMQTFIDFGVYNPTASEDGAGANSCSDGDDNGSDDGADRFDSDCATVALTYLPEPAVADEIFWTDIAAGTAVRVDTFGPGLVGHGGISGLVPPLPESSETGIMIRLQMLCPSASTTVPISLLVYEDPVAGTSGSLFAGPEGLTQIIPFVSPITLHCQ
ncbi:MAG: hypothetical protein IIC91_14280 [Chloroflexi bacterium]|nr:hypothetical protein [Chloroflexota bacterium]